MSFDLESVGLRFISDQLHLIYIMRNTAVFILFTISHKALIEKFEAVRDVQIGGMQKLKLPLECTFLIQM